jgi:predicted outer membrane repeat protein
VKHLTYIVALFLFSGVLSAETIFVSPQGTAEANGSSWTATTDLVTALANAKVGDEVWVQSGTYLPTTDANRGASFILPAGVLLYGGFAGTEADIDERPLKGKSTLSGNIGETEEDSDNVYTVLILAADADESSLIDGFIIAEGTARDFTQGFLEGNAGGGIFVASAESFLPAHQIFNCDFINNKAHNGGAIYVSAGNSSFDNCSFKNNTADFKGGAIYNQGAGTIVNTIFTSCHFENNAAKYGGAMTNNGKDGVATPLVLKCVFVRNVAKSNGAAIYNITNETGECLTITEETLFDGNESILGDVIATKGAKRSLAQKQSESDNMAIQIGGAKAKK